MIDCVHPKSFHTCIAVDLAMNINAVLAQSDKKANKSRKRPCQIKS